MSGIKLLDMALPKDCLVGADFKMTMMNPKFFPDPFKFDITRHNEENSEKRDPFTCAPFSAGPRACIGRHWAMM